MQNYIVTDKTDCLESHNIATSTYSTTFLKNIYKNQVIDRFICNSFSSASQTRLIILYRFKDLYKIINPISRLFVMLNFPLSALALLVGQQEGHPACKNWVLVCWWWWYDWSFARLIAPVVTITSITLTWNNIQIVPILVPDNPSPPGKWPLNGERDSRISVLSAATAIKTL